jgi:hypothetical protein
MEQSDKQMILDKLKQEGKDSAYNSPDEDEKEIDENSEAHK